MGDADTTDLVELEGELWWQYVRRQIEEMKAVNYDEGPFRAGWETAIEEFEVRLKLREGGE